VTICVVDFDAYILSFDKTGVLQSCTKAGSPTSVKTFKESGNELPRILSSRVPQKADD
jgi:hypothetical protein